LEFSPDGKFVASGGDKNVGVWHSSTGKPYSVFKEHTAEEQSLVFSNDGSRLYASGYRELIVLDLATKRRVALFPFKSKNMIALRLSDDETELNAVHTINDDLIVERYDLPATVTQSVSATAEPAVTTVPTQISAREKKLYDAVIAKPADDRPRLKYADWLDSKEDPRREFIRIQCQIASLGHIRLLGKQEKATRRKLLKQAQKLLEEHFECWTSQLAELSLRPGQAQFQRGFLWKLELNRVDLTDECLSILQRAPELEYLEMSGSEVTDAGLRHLKKVTNLTELVICETKVTPAGLKYLRSLQQLIRVYNSSWGNGIVKEVESFKRSRNARFLKLSKAKRRVEALRALPVLCYFPPNKEGIYRNISFSQSWATDADLVYLQAFPEVESLDFYECGAVTSKGLKHLAPLKKLKTLRISETSVVDLAPISQLKALENLEVDSLEQLKPRSFRHLSTLKKLTRLTVCFCRLGDEILKHISKCKQLRELDLVYNRFTSSGLEYLRALKNLEAIDIDYLEDHRELFEEI